ncbi:MAG: type III pantothenate kinase [Verrucomicrobiota bacterium]|jgi:type III pantothenate kinase
MIFLFDIGNTHTHVGLADDRRVLRQINVPTCEWFGGKAAALVKKFACGGRIDGAVLCSVVPRATPLVRKFAAQFGVPGTGPARKGKSAHAGAAPGVPMLELTSKTVRCLGIDYPKPNSIGPDRLANAVAARRRFGAPVVVVDFGTAVTFDVVNSKGNYAGGIIAPGLAAMTDYLHEKTALLPRIEIHEINTTIGKSTEQAMLIGAVHGYRGLVRELIAELKRELRAKKLPVVATGGYAKLMAAKLPEISAVAPDLTLEGLRLVWLAPVVPLENDTGGPAPP